MRVSRKEGDESESGGDAKVLLDILEDTVADGASLLDIAGLEREAEALRRGIGFVHRDVAPPHTPVVPEVVVRVVIIDPHGDLGLLRHWYVCVVFKSLLRAFAEHIGLTHQSRPTTSASMSSLKETPEALYCSKKDKSTQDAGLAKSGQGAVAGDCAQSLAGKLHADVGTFAAVELGNPDTLLLKVRVDSTVDRLGDVPTDTAFLLGKTGAVDAAALVRRSKRDCADSGHKIVVLLRFFRCGIVHDYGVASSKTSPFLKKMPEQMPACGGSYDLSGCCTGMRAARQLGGFAR